MPTYDHICLNEECKLEFEDFYSIKADLPKCPKCKSDVRRLISAATPGTVELTGHELNAKLKEDAAKLKREVYSSDKKYANIVGEDKYQAIQSRMDRRR